MSYNSKYSGQQVEEILDKANSSTNVTESTVANWGFTKNTGTYSKPSTGIPKSDLASAVQTSLGKADTALQSEQYKGTVTSVKINGTTKTPNTDGIVDLGTIEGGGSSSGGGAYAEVNHGTSDTTFTLTPNTFHVWDEVASLDLSFAEEQAGIANEYLFQFTSGTTATTLTLPDVKWANNNAPTIVNNKIYQVSILNGLASALEFDNTILISFTVDGVSYQAEEGMNWEEWVNSKYNTTKNYYFSDLDVLKRISDDYYIYDGEGNLRKQENIIDNFNYSAYYSGSNDDL